MVLCSGDPGGVLSAGPPLTLLPGGTLRSTYLRSTSLLSPHTGSTGTVLSRSVGAIDADL